MTERFDTELRFDRAPVREEEPELDQIARRLEEGRPTPRSAFRQELRRTLLEATERRSARVRRPRVLVAAYAWSGTVLLAVAALGIAGVGPLAAG
jgi:hypothetical protein